MPAGLKRLACFSCIIDFCHAFNLHWCCRGHSSPRAFSTSTINYTCRHLRFPDKRFLLDSPRPNVFVTWKVISAEDTEVLEHTTRLASFLTPIIVRENIRRRVRDRRGRYGNFASRNTCPVRSEEPLITSKYFLQYAF